MNIYRYIAERQQQHWVCRSVPCDTVCCGSRLFVCGGFNLKLVPSFSLSARTLYMQNRDTQTQSGGWSSVVFLKSLAETPLRLWTPPPVCALKLCRGQNKQPLRCRSSAKQTLWTHRRGEGRGGGVGGEKKENHHNLDQMQDLILLWSWRPGQTNQGWARPPWPRGQARGGGAAQQGCKWRLIVSTFKETMTKNSLENLKWFFHLLLFWKFYFLSHVGSRPKQFTTIRHLEKRPVPAWWCSDSFLFKQEGGRPAALKPPLMAAGGTTSVCPLWQNNRKHKKYVLKTQKQNFSVKMT